MALRRRVSNGHGRKTRVVPRIVSTDRMPGIQQIHGSVFVVTCSPTQFTTTGEPLACVLVEPEGYDRAYTRGVSQHRVTDDML